MAKEYAISHLHGYVYQVLERVKRKTKSGCRYLVRFTGTSFDCDTWLKSHADLS